MSELNVINVLKNLARNRFSVRELNPVERSKFITPGRNSKHDYYTMDGRIVIFTLQEDRRRQGVSLTHSEATRVADMAKKPEDPLVLAYWSAHNLIRIAYLKDVVVPRVLPIRNTTGGEPFYIIDATWDKWIDLTTSPSLPPIMLTPLPKIKTVNLSEQEVAAWLGDNYQHRTLMNRVMTKYGKVIRMSYQFEVQV